MKKQLLLSALVCWGLTTKSQTLENIIKSSMGDKESQLYKSSTTEEEYNYMAKGYKNHLTEGSDIKKGYSSKEDVNTITYKDYSFKMIPFYRSDKSFVGFIVKAHSASSGNDYWYGIPFKNPQLFNDFVTQVSGLDELMTNAFINAWADITRENITPETTEIEYNYMTVGYKNHLTDGSDLKKGYKINENTERTIKVAGSLANYTFTFTPFLRDNNSCVGTIIKLFSDGSYSGGTYYYAVPNSRGDLLVKFDNSKISQGTRVLHAFLQAYIQYVMED